MSIEEKRRAGFEARDGGEEAVSRYVVVEREFLKQLHGHVRGLNAEQWETFRALLDAPPPDQSDSKECYCNFRVADRAEIERLRAELAWSESESRKQSEELDLMKARYSSLSSSLDALSKAEIKIAGRAKRLGLDEVTNDATEGTP